MGQHTFKVLMTRTSTSLLVLLGIITLITSSNYPDKTGGYSITIAIEESSPAPQDANATQAFIDNIKNSITVFSDNLWLASRRKFFIKSTEILIPSGWSAANARLSSKQSYNTASIRVSPTASGAHVEHTFKCGQPGKFIELPVSFFNSTSSRYGPNWKALLNMWATYRWGVFEEHGNAGDSKYPYAWKNLTTEEWHVTGCSNSPIQGTFLQNGQSCSAHDTFNASSTCRFIVDEDATNATSSLMHFHWLDSVVEFCDETNHNKLSQNRHNFLCGHKSVWEVIRETVDYTSVTDPTDVQNTTFQIVQNSKKPALYILLDRGRIHDSVSVALAASIQRAVANFLTEYGLRETIASVFTYPGINGQSIQEEIEWLPIQENLDTFLELFGKLSITGPLERSFPEAILAVAEKVKEKNHPNGVVLLVIKYGANLPNFGSYDPEPKLIHALNDAGIVLNSIELKLPNHTGYAHLAELARRTDGIYTVLSNPLEAESSSLPNVFWYLRKLVSENYAALQTRFRMLLSRSVGSGQAVQFTVPQSINKTGKVEILYSTFTDSMNVSNFSIEGIASGVITMISNTSMEKRQEWNEEGSKWTYKFSLTSEMIAGYDEVIVTPRCFSCDGTIYMRTSILDDYTQNISVSVFINYDTNRVDLSQNEPVILYAKVLNMTSPIINAEVTATITEAKTGQVVSLRLTDDGEESPDEHASDGLYSAYFLPNRDGEFKVSVTVEGPRGNAAKNSLLLDHVRRRPFWQGKLLPIDQQMGCGGMNCDISLLDKYFMQSIDYPVDIEVSNVYQYVPKPFPVSMIIVEPIISSNTLKLSWPAPKFPGSAHVTASSYEIRQSSSLEGILLDFENQDLVQEAANLKPGVPGTLESVVIPLPSKSNFYALRSEYKGQKSKISRIASFDVKEQLPPSLTTTSIPTTTGTPTTTSSTTSSSSEGVTSSSTSSGPPITSTDNVPSSTITPTTTTQAINPPVDDTTPVPSDSEKKPWAKTGGGIAVITIAVIIVTAALIFAVYYILRSRCSSIIRINPPEDRPRSSVLQM